MIGRNYHRRWMWIVWVIPLLFLAAIDSAWADGDPVVAVPVASQDSGIYPAGFDLILSSATAGASIYYTKTTDGTIPSAPVPGTPGTVLYEGSIPVTGTTNIMAIAAMQVDSTWASSGIAFFSYSIINHPSPPPGGGGGGAGGPASAGGQLGYLDQSQVAFNNAFVTIENTAAWIQTFTPGTDCLLTAVGVHIRRSVDWDINQMGDLIMEIVATDTNGVPTNTVLGSAVVPRDYNFPSAEGYWSDFTFEATNFIFEPGIELQAGVKYGIRLTSPATAGGDNGLYYWPVYHDGLVDQYIPGKFFQQIGGGIPQSSSIDNMVDATFKTYMLPMAQAPMNSIKVDTASQQVYSGQSFPVEIKILQADNVYAADLELNFDPGVLQVAKVGAGQDLDNDGQEDQRPDVWVNLDDNNASNGEEPFTVIGANQVDNDLGRLRIAATRTGDSYLDRYLGFSGDATLARVMVRAVNPGFTVLDLAAELRGNAGAEDSVVELLPVAVAGSSIDVLPGGNNLSAWLRLQGTPDWEEDVWGEASLVSHELDTNQQPVFSQLIETAADGTFKFLDLPDGIYDLKVRRGGYLDRDIKDIVIANQIPVDLDRILLLTGDLSRDNWVDRGDLQLMRDAYGTQGDMESFDWKADLNNDNQVSILDLALMTRNYARKGAGGPYVWKPDAWFNAALGQVVLKATPKADIYYTIGTQEALPANPNRFDPTQLYIKGTGIAMAEGQVLRMIAVESYWGGASPVVTMTFEEILNH